LWDHVALQKTIGFSAYAPLPDPLFPCALTHGVGKNPPKLFFHHFYMTGEKIPRVFFREGVGDFLHYFHMTGKKCRAFSEGDVDL